MVTPALGLYVVTDRSGSVRTGVASDRLQLVAAQPNWCDATRAGLEVESWRGPSDDPLWPWRERVVLSPFRYSRAVSGSSTNIRLLLVEDVAQVAQYIRNLLTPKSTFSCSTSSPTDGQRSTRSAQSARTS